MMGRSASLPWLLALCVIGCTARSDEASGGASGVAAKSAPVSEDSTQASPELTSDDKTLPPPPKLSGPLPGLPALLSPDYNKTTAEKVALGELLFFDPRLSASGSMSCASCHQPEHGYASPKAQDENDANKRNARNTASLLNAAYANRWPWDAATDMLEAQVLSHWQGQMAIAPKRVTPRLMRMPRYLAHYARAFGAMPSVNTSAEALAAFVRTLTSGGSPWDRYEAGDRAAVDGEVVLGFEVFRKVAQCAQCHIPPLYSDYGLYALDVSAETVDQGHMRVSGRAEDQRAFRTPSLRGLSHTAPYFHDGSAESLETVVDRKLAAGIVTGSARVDRRLAAVQLSADQRRQLLAFLRALSRPAADNREPPKLPIELGVSLPE